jgi:hypothetical protein
MKSISKSLEEPKQSIADYHSSLYFDEATKTKIQRHLTDINDHISEQDIRNIDTNITTGSPRNNNLTDRKAN